MPVLVIKTHALTCIFHSFHFNGMGIVITQNARPVRCMQSQRITDAVWNFSGSSNLPSINLDPKPVFLINDLSMKVKQCSDLMIFHDRSISIDHIFGDKFLNFLER